MKQLDSTITPIDSDSSSQPILEAEHLRKHFPLRTANPFGQKKFVHAV